MSMAGQCVGDVDILVRHFHLNHLSV